MARLFFGLMLALLAWLLWVTVPRAIIRECPVCQGKGYITLAKPIVTVENGQLMEQSTILCPFCQGGKMSLYDLHLHQTQMLRWMVKDEKLDPEVLVKRVRDSFGQSGLDELHRNNFFMNEAGSSKP